MGVNKKHFGRCASDETQAVARQTGDWLGLRGGGWGGRGFDSHTTGLYLKLFKEGEGQR